MDPWDCSESKAKEAESKVVGFDGAGKSHVWVMIVSASDGRRLRHIVRRFSERLGGLAVILVFPANIGAGVPAWRGANTRE